jgi:threonine/homoserine/homoserine lactone efflux protein
MGVENWFDLLLALGIAYLAWLLYMIEENIDYSRKVIDKDKSKDERRNRI